MGVKRPFVSEDIQEHHKHPKPAESFHCHGISSVPDVSDGDKFIFPQYPCREGIENGFIFDIPYFDSEDFGMSGASSSLTRGSSEEDGESDRVGHLEDVTSSLDGSPERIVPVGPDYQARIPPWVGQMNYKSVYDQTDEDNEEKYLGTCIIPMPVECASQLDEDIVGGGRTDCGCIDKGSTRCVRQHVIESQEDLRSNLDDDEKFVVLGLANSGEDVVCEWSKEEEQLFYDIVLSNPASAGKNFWWRLSAAFPSRTKGELVTYYFNVFMLRKRATQNRCRFLEIDSDDDEWHENMDRLPEEVPEFPNASLGYKHNYQQAEHDKISTEEDEDDDGDADNDEDGMVWNIREEFTVKTHSEYTYGKNEEIGLSGDLLGPHDDSCTSFDYLLNSPSNTYGIPDGETAFHTKSNNIKSCKSTDDNS